MDVEIGEVVSTVRTVDSETLLSRDVLDRIVAAVVESMHAAQNRQRERDDDLDTRSIVEQQRAGKR
jgi:hypothetical protein